MLTLITVSLVVVGSRAYKHKHTSRNCHGTDSRRDYRIKNGHSETYEFRKQNRGEYGCENSGYACAEIDSESFFGTVLDCVETTSSELIVLTGYVFEKNELSRNAEHQTDYRTDEGFESEGGSGNESNHKYGQSREKKQRKSGSQTVKSVKNDHNHDRDCEDNRKNEEKLACGVLSHSRAEISYNEMFFGEIGVETSRLHIESNLSGFIVTGYTGNREISAVGLNGRGNARIAYKITVEKKRNVKSLARGSVRGSLADKNGSVALECEINAEVMDFSTSLRYNIFS